MNRWYVVHTHPRGERLAMVNLQRQGMDAYLPQYLKRRRHARRTQWIPAPLFPGYLFVAMDVETVRWRAIHSTVGVRYLVCHGDWPARVPAGSGRMATIGEIVELVRRITGCDKPVVQEDHRMRPADSEVMMLMADSARLREASGWAPKVSLEEGLAKTVDWWRGQLASVRAHTDYVM